MMEKIELGYTAFSDIGQKEDKGYKVIDFEKLNNFIEEHDEYSDNPATTIIAGLSEDWNNTSGVFYKDGMKGFKHHMGSFCGASYWATPSINITFEDGTTETRECYKEGRDSGISEWLQFIK
jgi:hypothetical protein